MSNDKHYSDKHKDEINEALQGIGKIGADGQPDEKLQSAIDAAVDLNGLFGKPSKESDITEPDGSTLFPTDLEINEVFKGMKGSEPVDLEAEEARAVNKARGGLSFGRAKYGMPPENPLDCYSHCLPKPSASNPDLSPSLDDVNFHSRASILPLVEKQEQITPAPNYIPLDSKIVTDPIQIAIQVEENKRIFRESIEETPMEQLITPSVLIQSDPKRPFTFLPGKTHLSKIEQMLRADQGAVKLVTLRESKDGDTYFLMCYDGSKERNDNLNAIASMICRTAIFGNAVFMWGEQMDSTQLVQPSTIIKTVHEDELKDFGNGSGSGKEVH
jgi:hypothetical protein